MKESVRRALSKRCCLVLGYLSCGRPWCRLYGNDINCPASSPSLSLCQIRQTLLGRTPGWATRGYVLGRGDVPEKPRLLTPYGRQPPGLFRTDGKSLNLRLGGEGESIRRLEKNQAQPANSVGDIAKAGPHEVRARAESHSAYPVTLLRASVSLACDTGTQLAREEPIPSDSCLWSDS